MSAPELLKPIPTQVMNERAAFGPVSLREFFKLEENIPLNFSAELSNGAALPQGLICTQDGVLTGIPGKNTQGNHEVVLTISNSEGSIQANFLLLIKPNPATEQEADYINKLKAQIWEALEHRLPVPDVGSLYDRAVTDGDIIYMLDRWGFIAIWDAFNLDALHDKKLLHLEGLNSHYLIYDQGARLIACPKDLFSHERTLEDGLQAARILAKEVYKRNWTVELTGTAKLTRAAWVEIKLLGDQYHHHLDIINYQPSPRDLELYNIRSIHQDIKNDLERGI